KEEYQTIVYDWNQTDRDYPKDKTIYQLFEEQVKANPDNIALVFEEQALSYNELNNRANQLARYIRQSYKQGTQAELKPDTLIALCLDRSLEMVISILAVMKAGGAYVPIDPEYPEDRIGYILEDTQAKIVLTQKWHEEKLSAIKNNFNNESKQNKQSIRLVDVNVEAINNEQEANLEQYSQSIDLAYVIYTSGTTGKPKGVMV
ncbi:AMP-binding protein, partial [Cysteiniphilum litorale]|uniref:AMP-binding protein n=1 Tax=Cysteiniphilum litorale TaxID=2056700 RepID=UPI003F8816D1